MSNRFAQLARWIHRHRIAVIVAWIALVAMASVGAARLPGALLEGTAEIPGSASQHVDHVLARRFDNPFTRLLLVAFSSDRLTVRDPAYRKWLGQAEATLETQPAVARTVSILDRPDARLQSADGHQTIVMVGLKAMGLQDQQRAVPELRRAMAPIRKAMLAADPTSNLAVTGHAAIEYDIDATSQSQSQKAESRVLLPSLLILLWAFGALVAASIPLIIAMAGVTVSLGAAYLLTFAFPVSSFLQNMVSMVGLAIGIDYALFMVSRFREAMVPEASVEDAVVDVMAHAGPAILYSGVTVMIGLLALIFTPLVELRSMGIGGSMVVIVSVSAALTLVPAVLSLVGKRVDSPRLWRRSMRDTRSEDRWNQLAQWVMRRPLTVLVAGTAAVLAIAAPTLRIHLAFSNARWFPQSMESRQGLDILAKLEQSNAVVPIFLVVRSTDGRPALSLAHVPALVSYAHRIEADPRVGELLSPVTLRPDLGLFDYLLLYRDLDAAIRQYPLIGQLFLSKDRRSALFEVVPGNKVSLNGTENLATALKALSPGPGLSVLVGGEPVYYNDFNTAMLRSYPLVVAFVIGITLIVLFAAFRSFLLPIKAVLMNLLSVGAGFGAIVAVFQLGWAGKLFGVPEPLGSILTTVPMLIFCVTFGLSMDYEVFLLSRIKEAYDRTGDNRLATAQGLASTGGIITSAALIMIVVFGAFAFTDIDVVKMVGLGEAVAIAVDATLIRIFLVPAFMRIAGRWNWIPGDRRTAQVGLGGSAATADSAAS